MPKVSVLVPIYNVERYLRKCLDSLVHQTLEDVEIICINDGSTDSSLEIIEEYAQKDNRIKIINKENSGYGASMNKGLEAATGEYIGIVEPDDYAELNMYEVLYTKAKEKDLDIVKSDFVKWWSNSDKKIKQGLFEKDHIDKVFNVSDYKEVLNIVPSIWSAIYKREFLQENGILFLETPGASYQDTGFHFKSMLAANRIMLINDAFVNYNQDNPNSSVKSTSKAYAVCKEFESIIGYIKEHNKLETLEYVYSIMFRAFRHNLLRLDSSLAKDYIDYYSDTFKNIYENESLGELFFSRCNKKELLTLISNKTKYYRTYRFCLFSEGLKKLRKQIISININKKKCSIVLFGKEIVRIG